MASDGFRQAGLRAVVAHDFLKRNSGELFVLAVLFPLLLWGAVSFPQQVLVFTLILVGCVALLFWAMILAPLFWVLWYHLKTRR